MARHAVAYKIILRFPLISSTDAVEKWRSQRALRALKIQTSCR